MSRLSYRTRIAGKMKGDGLSLRAQLARKLEKIGVGKQAKLHVHREGQQRTVEVSVIDFEA